MYFPSRKVGRDNFTFWTRRWDLTLARHKRIRVKMEHTFLRYTEIRVSTPCVAYIFLSVRVVTECLVTHHDISQLSHYYYLYSDLWAVFLPAQSGRFELRVDGKGGRPRGVRRYTHVLVLSDTSDTASRVASNGLGDEWSKEKEWGERGTERR